MLTDKQEKVFEEAKEKFRSQFEVELVSTGHYMEEEENGGIESEEYWIKGLIESPANGITFDVGGWFDIDTRDGDNIITCLLGLKINNQDIGDCKGFIGYYNKDSKTWDLVWDNY